MFSGIIDRLGEVKAVRDDDGARVFEIATTYADLALGESVAVNGVCLTVVTFDAAGLAEFYVSPESLARTSLGALQTGDRVNLERAVALETKLSGHLVQGHVDGIATLASIEEQAGAHLIELELSKTLGRYCVEKGSISLDGISLTINTLIDHAEGTRIGLTIIPHTWTHTNLQTRQVGDQIHVENDVIAKYVERLCHGYNAQ
ncbi:riboflavin synthase [Maritalea mediterranea]|uniref:Riboflavin synthase n=1 Tax=Maritalea mediterranea TaxID=2909667 RepID=A0ABS9EB52_9HYPH|nr:riboflavin synthase [Maritalea mediterranea]MCF4099119.1 riboflavin synthase [Maritalea mediterranea]